jgi:Asp-tRNA(Asn)/Glu-tRNA(Gln) amidotransferase A subunit family amidase
MPLFVNDIGADVLVLSLRSCPTFTRCTNCRQNSLTGYRTGQLSPVAVTQAVLEHIDRWEPHLCASYAATP